MCDKILANIIPKRTRFATVVVIVNLCNCYHCIIIYDEKSTKAYVSKWKRLNATSSFASISFAVDFLRKTALYNVHTPTDQHTNTHFTHSLIHSPTVSIWHHRNHPPNRYFIHTFLLLCWTLFFIGDYFPFKLIQSVSFFIALT